MPRVVRPIDVELEDGWRGKAIDLSATGLCLETLAVLPVDVVAVLTLTLPSAGPVRLRGRIAWSKPPNVAQGEPGSAGLILMDPPQAYLDWVATIFALE